MADCTRGDIPDDIYDAKDFGCKNDNLPVPDINGVVPDITGIRPDVAYYGTTIPSSCGFAEMWVAMGGDTFPMTNDSYSDTFMSWKSQIFTVPDAPVTPSVIQNFIVYDRMCDGLACRDTPPCGTPTPTEYNPYAGTVNNKGVFGSTFQFFFNIYKVYCCIYNDDGEVIDFNIFYYFSITEQSSTYGFRVLNYGGTIDFCSPFSLGAGAMVIGVSI